MDLTKVFIIPFHVKRLKQSSIMPNDLSGAYVSCYSTGRDYIEATEKSLKKLSGDGLYPEEIMQPIYEMVSENWTQHVGEMWPDQAESMISQADFEDIVQGGGVVYGPFGSYA
ncbi:hypothetical protein [Duganella sp. Leaf126]|uniref:hypothetical protein n=1 Tax=Duganella sp. Leaf126 TaxID=1736266 RepID=UPI0019110473|nr:hypothetical protein [Duganella sp. Leaf126]